MIDLTKIQYRVVVMDESKNQYNIKEYIENLGWEENDGELSVRTSFVAKNDKTSKGYLSKIIKPGCLVGVFATDGASQDEEVARGYVETWNPVEKSGGHTLKCTCYDEPYKLQVRRTVLGSRWQEVQDVINAGNKKYYTIKSGDTLSGIAAKYETTVNAIAQLNGIENPNLIIAGDTIRVK